MKIIFMALILSVATIASAQDEQAPRAKKKVVVMRKTQVVDFAGDTVDGTARHPDAAYLVQKRGVDFVPLYKVRERFDENIKASVDYLK